MKTSVPWLGIAQLVLLVLWFTAYPGMPGWLVFLPVILVGTGMVVCFGALLVWQFSILWWMEKR